MIKTIEFYVKNKEIYLPIGVFDRHIRITEVTASRLPHKMNEMLPITRDFLQSGIECVNDIISNYKAKIDACNRDIETVKSLQGNTISEKFSAMQKINDTIDEYLELISDYSTVKNYYVSLIFIIDSLWLYNDIHKQEIDKDNYIFIKMINS